MKKDGLCNIHSCNFSASFVRLPWDYGNMATVHGDGKVLVLVSKWSSIWTLSRNSHHDCKEKRKGMEVVLPQRVFLPVQCCSSNMVSGAT